MTDFAPLVSAFLQTYLPCERRASRHTVLNYTDSIRLLVVFVAGRLGVQPCRLQVEHFTVEMVLDFLEFLERDRGNTIGTRNVRLAAVKSFFRYLEYRVPACLDLASQIRSIPKKRADKPLIDWLDAAEVQALLDAPDLATAVGIRDCAMLHLTFACGLRVSEVTSLALDNLSWPGLDSIRVIGKGRRERELPLWKETRTVLTHWLDIRPQVDNRYLFLNARGKAMSRDGFAWRLDLHVATAAKQVSSLAGKRVTPHVLRHSCAMNTLQATGDIRKVALWLGHANIQSTEVYLRANPVEKLEILGASTSPTIRKGSFAGVQDSLMALLNGI